MYYFHSESDIFIHSLLFKKSEILEHHSNLLPQFWDLPSGQSCYILTGNYNGSLICANFIKYQPYKGCLTRTTRSNEEDEIAFLNANSCVL